jgi:hypothetical protein
MNRRFASLWCLFNLAPDDLSGAAAAPPPGGDPSQGTPPAAPPATPAPAPVSASAAPASDPSQGGQGGLGGTPAAAPPPPPPTLRDQLRNYGIDLSYLPSDDAALAHLSLQMQQQQLAAQQAQAAQWQQQQYRQQVPQQQKPWFEAPEFDPNWRNVLYRDAAGNLRVQEGHDPTIPLKYTKALEHQQNFMQKFAFDPVGAIKPGVQELIRSEAQAMVQQALAQQAEQQRTDAIFQQNPWMFERGRNADGSLGQPVINPNTGREVLSQEGRAYFHYLQQVQASGVRDVQAQHQHVMAYLQRDALIAQAQAANPAIAQQQANAAFLAANRPNTPGVQASQPANSVVAAAATNGLQGRSRLQQMMQGNFAAAGYRPGDEIAMPGVH